MFLSKILKSVCVICGARILLHRLSDPQFDACGFEHYEFDCVECKSPLVGIIDPWDDGLLLESDG